MEVVIIVIMLMVGFSLVLKLTYLPIYGKLLVGIVCALFVGMSWEEAASQSKTQIESWIQDPGLMLDMAVLLTVDVFLQMAFCMIAAKRVSGEVMTKWDKAGYAATLWIPGILIFPTLFALLVEVIFSFPGMDFNVIAWSLAAVVFVSVVALTYLMAWMIPEKDLRLELIFMVNSLIAMLGIVATVNGRTAVSGTNSVDWQSLLGIIVILLLGASAGLLLYRRKFRV